MTAILSLVLIGVICWFFSYKMDKDSELDLRRMNYMAELKEKFSEEILDELSFPMTMGGFFYLSESEAYKSLSKKERENLIWYLMKLNDWDDEWKKTIKQIDYLRYAGTISLFTALILFGRDFL